VVEGVRRHKLSPLVVDPVMVATSGDMLLEPDAVDALRRELIPLADIITPNLHEAARLLDVPLAADEGAMQRQAQALLVLGAKAVLIKGGHGVGAEAVDFLVTSDAPPERLALPRIDTRNTHGTGCTLSAAIAAHLAIGASLSESVSAAKHIVHAALAAGASARIGGGAGPLDHLFGLPRARKY
jgi:hydroxymethylpyrimidine/phosphomethylpyrimidine kinase